MGTEVADRVMLRGMGLGVTHMGESGSE